MPLTSVFSGVLRMSLFGGAIVLLVLFVRLGLKKAPKIYSYILWAAVLFRLLCPFAIPVEILLPEEAAETAEEPSPAEIRVPTAPPSQDSPYAVPRQTYTAERAFYEAVPVPAASVSEARDMIRETEPEAAAEPVRLDREAVLNIGAAVWITGAVLLFTYNTVSLVRLKIRMIGATPLKGEEGVWLADHVETAFVWGVLRPVIVLPSSLKGRARSYVIRHERTHIRRGDPVWRLFAFAALLVHWFNPLVWLAFRLSGKDMEMSCDEAVMRTSERDIRADYSETLLRFAAADMSLGTSLAFGEGETGSRVKNVMRYRKPALWVSLAALLVLVSSAAVFAVRPTARDPRLPNTRYLIGPVLYDPVGGRETMLRDTYGGVELAGDGTLSLYVNEWNRWETLGASEACTEEAAALFASVREMTGVRFRSITEARYVPAEEGDGGWLIACDGVGRVYLASVRLGEEEKVFWICSLKSAAPKPSLFSSVSVVQTGFYQRSLIHPVGRPVTTLGNIRVDELGDYELVFFSAEQDETDVPGLALFERFDSGRAARLVCWSLADGVTVEKTEGGIDTSFTDGVFTAAFPDGTELSAEVELPVKTKDFLGRVTSVSGGSVTFVNLPAPAVESEAGPDEKESALIGELEDCLRKKAEAEEARRLAEAAARLAEEAAREAAEAEAAQTQEERTLAWINAVNEEIARAAEEEARRAAEEEARRAAEEAAARTAKQMWLQTQLTEAMQNAEQEMAEYRRVKEACEEQLKALEGQNPEKVLKLREKLEQKKAEAEAALAAANAVLNEYAAKLAAAEDEPMTPTPADPSVTDSSDASAGAWGWENDNWTGAWGWGNDNWKGQSELYERGPNDLVDLQGRPYDDRDPDAVAADLAFVKENMVCPLPAGYTFDPSAQGGTVAIDIDKNSEYFQTYDVNAGTPVLAVRDGVVEQSEDDGSVGGQILIRHVDGTSSVYQFLSERYAAVGDPVAKGSVIGKTGTNPNGRYPEFRIKVTIDSVLYSHELFHALPVVEARYGGRTTELFSDPSGSFGVSVGTLLAERQAGREPNDFADRDVVFPLPEGTEWSVACEFGWCRRYGMDEYHFGIDFGCDRGTDVLAYTDGEVEISGYHASYGNYVVIDHGGNLATLYAHLDECLVTAGDTVEAGQPIGTVGLTGSVYENCLHFEVLFDGAARDPRGFLPGMMET
ncbi:MAG: peptidoglycan DD-metalloendopeptidase family protein [Clostridia bacterium]|nr:peptidoglycan DD-metalloendopeptidase family protein [Clostridia bacterium]